NNRPAILRREDTFLDCALECIIMRDDQPIRIARGNMEFVRDWLARNPDLHRRVIYRIGDAPNAGVRFGGIAPRADIGQVDRRSGFEVAMKDAHGSTEYY